MKKKKSFFQPVLSMSVKLFKSGSQISNVFLKLHLRTTQMYSQLKLETRVTFMLES